MAAALLVGLGTTAPAAADPPDRPGNLQDCLAAAQGMTMEVDFCLDDELNRQDQFVEKAYETAMLVAEDQQREGLEESQHAWDRYREVYCGAKGAASGSGRTELMARCRIRLSIERRQALEAFDVP